MKLINVEMIPGVVINSNDDKGLGRVKCSVPGLFDPSVMPEDTLPWVYPLTMTGYQSFSKMMKGSKVWVIQNYSTYNEYWYIPFADFGQKTKDVLSQYYGNDVEVLMMRQSGSSTVSITYDNVNGYQLNIGDSSYLHLNEKSIELKNQNTALQMNGETVKIGNTSQEYHNSVNGDKLNEILTKLCDDFKNLQQLAQRNPYTTGLCSGFAQCANELSNLDDILAKNTKIN